MVGSKLSERVRRASPCEKLQCEDKCIKHLLSTCPVADCAVNSPSFRHTTCSVWRIYRAQVHLKKKLQCAKNQTLPPKATTLLHLTLSDAELSLRRGALTCGVKPILRKVELSQAYAAKEEGEHVLVEAWTVAPHVPGSSETTLSKYGMTRVTEGALHQPESPCGSSLAYSSAFVPRTTATSSYHQRQTTHNSSTRLAEELFSAKYMPLPYMVPFNPAI